MMTRGNMSSLAQSCVSSMLVASRSHKVVISLVNSPLAAFGGHLWVGMAVV